MKQISSGEALRELNKWNKDSLLGCIYTSAGAGAVFSIRQGKLEVREPDIFLEAETGKALMHLLGSATFGLVGPSELPIAPLVQQMGYPPLAETALRVLFPNRDVCFFFPER